MGPEHRLGVTCMHRALAIQDVSGLGWGQSLCSHLHHEGPGAGKQSSLQAGQLVWMVYLSMIFILMVFHLLLELTYVWPHGTRAPSGPSPQEIRAGPPPLPGTHLKALSRPEPGHVPGISLHAEVGGAG